MHKLSLYLNNEQYDELTRLAEITETETAEEYANEMFYTSLSKRAFILHPDALDPLARLNKDFDRSSIPPAPTCPICGKKMAFSGYNSYYEEAYSYECENCGAQSRLLPYPAEPRNCFAEFSKAPMYVEARRKDGMDKPGFNITGFMYTYSDVIEIDILSKDQENVTFEDLCRMASEAFLAYLPFSEKYTTPAIEDKLTEYIQTLRSDKGGD